jgi:hypothetical protein
MLPYNDHRAKIDFAEFEWASAPGDGVLLLVQTSSGELVGGFAKAGLKMGECTATREATIFQLGPT